MVELVSATFENGKSMRDGYANVGISFDPNQSVSANADRLSSKGVIPTRKELRELNADASEMVVPEDTEMDSWKEVMEIPDVKAKGRNVFLAPFERAYWQRLIAKHGDNYAAMARDIKLNNYQHTQRVCEKKCALYKEKYNDDLSRKSPAVRKREVKKQLAAARAKTAPSNAPLDSESESNSQDGENEVDDIIESLSDMSDLSSGSGSEEEEDFEISSDEEEFAPPPKKKFVTPPTTSKHITTKKKNVKSR